MGRQRTFSYWRNKIRVVYIDGKMWWVAKDICDLFEHRAIDALATVVPDADKRVWGVWGEGGCKPMLVVSAFGVYALVSWMWWLGFVTLWDTLKLWMFRRWVDKKVHGRYLSNAQK